MVIFHLISSIDKGGAETHLFSLINQQVQQKKKVVVIYLKGNDYWKKYYKKIGVEVHKINLENILNIIQFLLALHQIRKLINQLKSVQSFEINLCCKTFVFLICKFL